MRGTAIIVILMTLSGCDVGLNAPAASPTASPSPEVSATASATQSRSPVVLEKTQFLKLPEIGSVKVTVSCQFIGPDGPVLRAGLATGGSLQLRRINGTEVMHVSALPSPEADPVSTRAPSDTSYTEEDGYITGTSRLRLNDSDNRIEVSFRIHWDDSTPPCP